MKQIYFIAFAAAVMCMLAVLPAIAQQETSYEVEYVSPQIYKDFRFSIGGGYAFRLGEVEKTGDPKLDDLNKQLQHGFTVDADAQYFFKEGWGLGLNANYCSSPTSGDNVTIPDVGNVNRYKESQNALFVGPSFAGRIESSKFLLVSSIALGPLFYMDRMNLDGTKINASQTTFGINAGVAGEYKLNAKTGLGLKLSYTLGNISSVNIAGQNVKYDEPVSISNIMITAFLSFRTW
ncbi:MULTISPECIES: outer membrane beta-barrel protein [Proteiniphilum]|uniref:outer membrane beta-barrel protein n=1 Tax=Proteiniphilum TaxID=294702 RepID=UPI0028AA95B7|nr:MULTISPECIES: outer membrane beta-barrel protein [Proteiniphilum]MDY9919097.1 outer membrane beta-barrel protein [Proteiniphilum sp.]